jgi:hypothetical protein
VVGRVKGDLKREKTGSERGDLWEKNTKDLVREAVVATSIIHLRNWRRGTPLLQTPKNWIKKPRFVSPQKSGNKGNFLRLERRLPEWQTHLQAGAAMGNILRWQGSSPPSGSSWPCPLIDTQSEQQEHTGVPGGLKFAERLGEKALAITSSWSGLHCQLLLCEDHLLPLKLQPEGGSVQDQVFSGFQVLILGSFHQLQQAHDVQDWSEINSFIQLLEVLNKVQTFLLEA